MKGERTKPKGERRRPKWEIHRPSPLAFQSYWRSPMTRKNIFLLTLLTFISLLPVASFAADPSSTNYQAAESYFSAGIGNAQSANYKIDEGNIDSYKKDSASSTNYSLQGKVGISGTAKLPVINSTTPASYAKFFSDQSASYNVSATSTDGDSLQYRAKQDGTVKAGPQSSSTLSWALGSSALGRRAHNLEVIDPDGTVVKPQAAYIYRRPVK